MFSCPAVSRPSFSLEENHSVELRLSLALSYSVFYRTVVFRLCLAGSTIEGRGMKRIPDKTEMGNHRQLSTHMNHRPLKSMTKRIMRGFTKRKTRKVEKEDKSRKGKEEHLLTCRRREQRD
jgi:hypothetical protein